MRSRSSKPALCLAFSLVGVLAFACAGSDESEPVYMVEYDSGDPPEPGETSPLNSGRGFAPSNAGNAETRTDADNDAGNAPIDAGDTAEESPDASEESPEALDASEESPDASEESPDASEESPDAELAEDLDAEDLDAEDLDAGNDCAGMWELTITPQIYCFRSDRPLTVELLTCAPDLEISVDTTDPMYGHFVGTVIISLEFNGDSANGTAQIDGVVTIGDTVTGPCSSPATVIGRKLEQ